MEDFGNGTCAGPGPAPPRPPFVQMKNTRGVFLSAGTPAAFRRLDFERGALVDLWVRMHKAEIAQLFQSMLEECPSANHGFSAQVDELWRRRFFRFACVLGIRQPRFFGAS